MYNTSVGYMKHILSNSREWDMYIDVTLADGTTFKLTKDNISLGTPTLKEGATCSDTIQIGSTYSNSFEFSILNNKGQYSDYDFYKARIEPYSGLYVPVLDEITGEVKYWECEYIPLGVFWVLENVKKLSTIPIVCFDRMSLTNKVFDFSTLVFPTDCATVFDEVVTQCDIPVSESLVSEIASLEYPINSLLTNDPTCRDILAGFGIMLQKNLRFNRVGVLESFWYTKYSHVSADGTDIDRGATSKQNRVGNSSYGDNQIVVTGVYLEDAYGNTFSVGTEEYPVELPTSPIIQGADMATPILEAALQKFQKLPHRLSSISYSGDPAIQAGDILVHNETPVGNIALPVMRLVYKFAGIGSLDSLGTDTATQNQQSSTDKRLKKAFSRADKDRYELETKIEQTANEVLIQAAERFAYKSDMASLSVKVDGISADVAHAEETIEGLRSDIVSVQQSATDLSITVQQVIDNGAEKVTTKEAKYTFDDDGLKIAKSGEEMANKLDNTGMYVTRSGETILQASNEGVIATDVKVRNYLIVGSHARFEDYSDGSDRNRTACFYITSEEVATLGLR